MSAQIKHPKQPRALMQALQFFILLLATCIAVSCSYFDEDVSVIDFPLVGTSLSMEDIAGNWTATSAEFQLVGDSGSLIEIVGAGGGVSFNIQNNGRFTSTISFPGADLEQFLGQLGFSGDQLVLLDDEDEPGDEAFIDITLTPQDVLLLSGILEFDFDGDGSFEPTNVDLAMIR